MSRATMGGSRIATKPTRNVAGGMAEANLTRLNHLMGHARPRWADDPAQTLPCQEPAAAPNPQAVDPAERDIFHPVVSGELAKEAIELAQTFCNRCPFGPAGQGPGRDACLEHGLANGEWGIWGGRKLDGLGQNGRRVLLAEIRKRRGAA
jgi:hypothetical protein